MTDIETDSTDIALQYLSDETLENLHEEIDEKIQEITSISEQPDQESDLNALTAFNQRITTEQISRSNTETVDRTVASDIEVDDDEEEPQAARG
jgi:hypothetical protein